jgi:hypothetical protein
MDVSGGAGTPVGVVSVQGCLSTGFLAKRTRRGIECRVGGRLDAAQMRTAWGSSHLRRFALMSGDEVLASPKQYQLTGASIRVGQR